MIKLFLIIFCAIGLCYGLEPAHHYRYKYFGSFTSGIPENGDQVNGFAMQATIDVFSENNDGLAVFKLSDVATLSFYDELGISKKIDFTSLNFQQFEDEEIRGIFEQPFRVNLRDSKPFSLECEETDHHWIVNVRKGIASMFKNEILKGNFETQVEDSISSFFHQGHVVNNFEVEEETLFGICESTYKIYKTPEGMFRGGDDLMSTVDESDQKDLWHVSRSIDFDKCKEIVAMHLHTTNKIRHKQNKLRFTRTSVSNYVLRGSPGYFDIYSIATEGTTTFPLSIFGETEAQSIVNQKLVLIDHNTTEALPELGANLKHSETWMHEVWTSSQKPKEVNPHPWVSYLDKNEHVTGYEIFGIRKYDADQIAAVKINILKLIKEASQRLTDLNYEAEYPPGETDSDSLELATLYFRYLKKAEILKIFDHIFEEKVGIERQLVINAAAASGYHDAFEAIMDYVEQDKLQRFQIFTTFATMTRNSYGALNISRIMDFVLHQEKPSEYLLNFAHYLSEYCIHKVHNYIPILGDSECDATLITTHLIPYLKEIIYNESLTWERGYAVKALALLKTGFNVEILSPLIDGRIKASVELKAMAVRAFEFWFIYPEDNDWNPIITDMLTDAYSDVSQDLHVRIAALLALTSWKPSTKFWSSLALSTWTEPSKEFASFASSLIKIYSEDHPTLEKQSEGASYALKFAKPPSTSSHSFNIALSKEFFNRQARFSLLVSDYTKGEFFKRNEFVSNIVTNIHGLNLYKEEGNILYEERVTLYNETVSADDSQIPYAKEFLDKFLSEIHLVQHSIKDKKISESFYQILGDSFLTLSSIGKNSPFTFPPSDINEISWGAFLYLLDKWDFHPNELGLPLYVFSSLPTTMSFTNKALRLKSEEIQTTQALLKISSVYSMGISVFLPWNHEFSTAMVRSALEMTLPLGIKIKPRDEKEGSLTKSNIIFDIAYKKKFPLIRFWRTPAVLTYDMDPRSENVILDFKAIREVNTEEKNISEIDSTTGIKYDLVMRSESPISSSIFTFLKFNVISFRAWALDFYLVPEESETKELLIEKYDGKLLHPDDYEDSGFLSDTSFSEENMEKGISRDEVTYFDNFWERSQKIRKLIRSAEQGDVTYGEYRLNFIGDVPRNYSIFNSVFELATEHEGHPSDYVFQTFGFTSFDKQHQPKSFCFNAHTYQHLDPGRYFYDSASSLQGRHVKNTKLEVLRHCTDNVLKIKVLYNISNENYIRTEEYCIDNYGEKNCYVERADLLAHDKIQVIFYKRANDTTQDVINFIQSFFEIPSTKGFGYEIGPDPQFNIRRTGMSKNWDLYLKHYSEDVFLSTFSSNILFRYFFNYPTSYEIVEKVLGVSLKSHSKCTLTKNSVETFDGLHYNYELSDCWTLVSQIESSSDTERNAFLIRRPQGGSLIPDFKYIMFEKATVIEFSKNELKVNGSTVHKIKEENDEDSGEEGKKEEDSGEDSDEEKDDSDEENENSEEEKEMENSNFILTIEKDFIYKRGNTYLIYHKNIYKRPYVILSVNKIEFYKETRFLNSNGICGNGNGETIPELIGPKKCVYNDPQLFTASWTGQSENCDFATLEKYRQGVEDYQAKCEPYGDHPEDSKLNPRCLFHGWKVLTINGSYCISAAPMLFCSSSCDIKKLKTINMAYKCWPKEKAPERLRTSIENDVDIVTDNFSEDPNFYQNSYTNIAEICKQF